MVRFIKTSELGCDERFEDREVDGHVFRDREVPAARPVWSVASLPPEKVEEGQLVNEVEL